MAPHPLQAALDRVTVALYTSADLMEIAQMRKAPGGRSDARQEALYRAVVASCVGALEEAAEALTCEALRCQGANPGMALVQTAIGKLMQTPNSRQIGELMSGFLDYHPVADWKVRLWTSAPAYANPKPVGQSTAWELWSYYGQERSWSGDDAASVMDRFVKIRHAFAHQDSSTSLLTKRERSRIRDVLSKSKASGPDDVSFIEQLSAACAVRVLNPVNAVQDPVHDWRLHETHAVNALLCTLGVISSMADGLARFLEQHAGVQRATYDPLQLRVQTGKWENHAGELSVSPCAVDWALQPYAPLSR
jgi:hypothetical protein